MEARFSPENLSLILSNEKLREMLFAKHHEELFDNHDVEEIHNIEDFLKLNKPFDEREHPACATLWGSFHNSFDLEREGIEFPGKSDHEELDSLISAKSLLESSSEKSDATRIGSTQIHVDAQVLQLSPDEYLNLLTNPPELERYLDARQKEIDGIAKGYRQKTREYMLSQLSTLQNMLGIFEKGSMLYKSTQVYIDWLNNNISNSFADIEETEA